MPFFILKGIPFSGSASRRGGSHSSGSHHHSSNHGSSHGSSSGHYHGGSHSSSHGNNHNNHGGNSININNHQGSYGSHGYHGHGHYHGTPGIIPIPIFFGGVRYRYVYCEDPFQTWGYGYRVDGFGWDYGPCY